MKKKSIFILLMPCFIFLCFTFVSCAEVNEFTKKAKNKESEEEILLGRNILNEKPLWCGKNNTLIYHTNVGLFAYDIKSGEKVKIGNGFQSPLACTPNGKWLIYMNKSSARYDKLDNSRGNADLWRYEFKTGRNEKFMIVDENNTLSAKGAIFSPKGSKLYFVDKPSTTMEMPKPKWKVVWLERESAGRVWFKKPLALIGDGVGRYQDGALVIDVISPYKKQFVMDAGFHDSSIQMIDAQERIYMRTADDNFGHGWQTVRCFVDVDKITISCEAIFKDIMAEGHPSFGYEVTKDGDFAVIANMDDNCVRLRRIGESGGRCITSDDITVGTTVSISPDEKWLVFDKSRLKDEKYYRSDLYITRFNRD